MQTNPKGVLPSALLRDWLKVREAKNCELGALRRWVVFPTSCSMSKGSRKWNSMRNLAPRIALAWMLISMPPGAAFGQQTAKDPFIPEANVQNAGIYNDRGIAKQNKGDLDG